MTDSVKALLATRTGSGAAAESTRSTSALTGPDLRASSRGSARPTGPRDAPRARPASPPERGSPRASVLPGRPRTAASSRSWVTRTTVVPSASNTCSSSCCSSPRVTGSSAPSGSSRRTTAGRSISARIRLTRCRCPPESSRGQRPRTAGSRRTSPASSSRRRARQSAGFFSARANSVTLSAAVRCGKSPPDWSPNPIRRRSAGPASTVTGIPSSKNLPGIRRQQARHESQQSALPAPALAEEHRRLTAGYLERERPDGEATVEAPGHVAQDQHGVGAGGGWAVAGAPGAHGQALYARPERRRPPRAT